MEDMIILIASFNPSSNST